VDGAIIRDKLIHGNAEPFRREVEKSLPRLCGSLADGSSMN
jgi:hypothetical protein